MRPAENLAQTAASANDLALGCAITQAPFA
jgi:hypothetical protein